MAQAKKTKAKAKEQPKAEKEAKKPKEPKKASAKKQESNDIPVQPAISIGLVGHVDHGKTTIVSKLSGKWTDTHSEEIKRGITIRLGYANAVFYKCPKCQEPGCYGISKKCSKCNSECIPLRKVSFIDAPGHESLMATMLAGSAIMDCALLIVAANEECPQPQTKEHLMALDICGIKSIIIVQNKIDLVSEEAALKNYEQIKSFVKGSIAENAPIVPISAQHNVNIDLLIKTIEEYFKTPKRDSSKEPIMFIARSFDINKPGTEFKKLNGGVLGGSLKQGVIKVGDSIEIRPGRKVEKEGRTFWLPVTTKVIGLVTGDTPVKEVGPGGSFGLLTELDPFFVKSDSMTGNITGLPNKLPQVWSEFDLEPHLLQRVVGAKKDLEVEPIKKGEVLMLNVNSSATVGIVTALNKGLIHANLKMPVCAMKEDRVTISRRLEFRYRLIGYGMIKS